MWVFTTCGFYSVVKKSHSTADELEVRGRCRKDLEVLKRKTGAKSKILANAGTDYPFRVRINREIWARFLAELAMEIDYPNFKDEVLFNKAESARARKRRHNVYHEVWKALLSLSETSWKKKRYIWRDLEDHVEDDQHFVDSVAPDSSSDLPGTTSSRRKPSSRFQQSKFWEK